MHRYVQSWENQPRGDNDNSASCRATAHHPAVDYFPVTACYSITERSHSKDPTPV